MSKLNRLFKCEVCGLITEVTKDGFGKLVCCGKPMEELKENTTDASVEKHTPVIEKVENGVLVKVGSVEHPMEEKHLIEWIELHTNNSVYRKYLKAEEKPEVIFNVEFNEDMVAKAYCNLHGYWKNK